MIRKKKSHREHHFGSEMTCTRNKSFQSRSRYHRVLFPLFSVVFLFSACTHSDQEKPINQILSIDERLGGSPLEVTTGQSFYVEMRNPASGGYLIQEPEFDKNILQMREQRSIPPPVNDKKAGDFGRMIYIFKAISPEVQKSSSESIGPGNVIFRQRSISG